MLYLYEDERLNARNRHYPTFLLVYIESNFAHHSFYAFRNKVGHCTLLAAEQQEDNNSLIHISINPFSIK